MCSSKADSERKPAVPGRVPVGALGEQVVGASLGDSYLVIEWSTYSLGKPSPTQDGHFSENHHVQSISADMRSGYMTPCHITGRAIMPRIGTPGTVEQSPPGLTVSESARTVGGLPTDIHVPFTPLLLLGMSLCHARIRPFLLALSRGLDHAPGVLHSPKGVSHDLRRIEKSLLRPEYCTNGYETFPCYRIVGGRCLDKKWRYESRVPGS